MVVIRAANELLASGQCVWLNSSSVTYVASYHYASSCCTRFLCNSIAPGAVDMFAGAIEAGYDQHAVPPRLHVAAMPCLGGESYILLYLFGS